MEQSLSGPRQGTNSAIRDCHWARIGRGEGGNGSWMGWFVRTALRSWIVSEVVQASHGFFSAAGAWMDSLIFSHPRLSDSTALGSHHLLEYISYFYLTISTHLLYWNLYTLL